MKKQKQPKAALRFDQEGLAPSNNLQQKDEPFNSKAFEASLQVALKQSSADSLEFDIEGIDVSVANALRRILIAEVPTMAFHKVLLFQNTSVIPDEVLVHRIGLLPLRVDAAQFKYRRDDDSLDSSNSLKFELRVKCTRKPQYAKLSDEELLKKGLRPEQYLDNAEVYANQLRWVPQGSQQEQYPQGIRLVHEDILVIKLRENQEVTLEVFAEKGIGRTHAKWSPVSTAYYRLAPEITLLPSFNQERAADLVASCPVGVFDLEDSKAHVRDARKCTTCRQCIKYEGVSLAKRNEHFICK